MNPKFVGSPQAAPLTQMESDIINFLDTIPSELSKERFTVTGD
jgi:hypothetical protein